MSSLPLFANALIVLATIVVIGLGAHWVVESATRRLALVVLAMMRWGFDFSAHTPAPWPGPDQGVKQAYDSSP